MDIYGNIRLFNDEIMKKYYSVKRYAEKVGKTSQAIYNQIKTNKLEVIEVEIGTVGKKNYIIVEEE